MKIRDLFDVYDGHVVIKSKKGEITTTLVDTRTEEWHMGYELYDKKVWDIKINGEGCSPDDALVITYLEEE